MTVMAINAAIALSTTTWISHAGEGRRKIRPSLGKRMVLTPRDDRQNRLRGALAGSVEQAHDRRPTSGILGEDGLTLARTAAMRPIPWRENLVAVRRAPQRRPPSGLVASPGIRPRYRRQGEPASCPLAAVLENSSAAGLWPGSLSPPEVGRHHAPEQREREHRGQQPAHRFHRHRLLPTERRQVTP